MNGRAYGEHIYEDGDPGPVPGSTPLCPICPADRPHRVVPNEGKAGGYVCEGCDFWLSPDVAGSNTRRREVWEFETQRRVERGS